MTDTSQLWYSLNKDCSDIPKTPVESYSDSKEQTNKFSNDIKALGEYFPQLASLLNEKDSTDYYSTLEISLKEIFVLCPRNRCRLDRYSKLQEYLKKNYNVTLIIKSQKTKDWLMKNCLTANNRALITIDTQVQESLNEYTGGFTLFRAQELEKTKADIIFQTAY